MKEIEMNRKRRRREKGGRRKVRDKSWVIKELCFKDMMIFLLTMILNL